MKRILSALISVICAVSLFQTATIYAAEGAYITQYYSGEDKITAYVTGISSDNIDVRISGKSCEAVNNGDIYNNSEKYETYFLIDSSKSMQIFSDEIDTFLRECIDAKPDNEYYHIGLFSSNNNPEYLISDEKNQYSLEKILSSINYDFNSTYIYDNLINTIRQLTSGSDNNYKRIVLLTDGNENSAKGITIDDVTDELKKSPVPVYTVTFQTKDKSNLENLKNISRLARFSNSADMRITDGDDAAPLAKTLFEDLKNTYCIEVTPDVSLVDGSIKAIEISDGSISVSADIRMFMIQAPETVSEITTVTTVSETTTAITTSTAPSTDDKKNESNTLVIILVVVAAVVVCAVVIVCIIIGSKKKKSHTTERRSGADNGETEIISTGGGGQTEMLFEGDAPQYRTLVLRDSADSMRTFEVQLSSSGAVIGRSSDMADIVIDYDKAVSRKHCKIYLSGNKAYIEDLGSGNKTYVNNSEVTSPCTIGNADEIKIGRTKLKVTLK